MVFKKIYIFLVKYFIYIYICLPIFTGVFSYNWLPNESFDQRIHEKIRVHVQEFQDNPVNSYNEEIVDKWKSIESGNIYSKDTFAKHRHQEAFRISITFFLYGLIYCLYKSFTALKNNESYFIRQGISATLKYHIAFFFRELKGLILLDLLISIIIFYWIYR